MATKTQRLYIWCGPVSMVVLFAGLLIGRLLPFPRPNENAAQLAAFLNHHTTAVRTGALIAMFGGALFGPWVAAIATQLKRVEGGLSPAAYLQLALGALAVIEIILPFMILETAAFRPDRSPAELQTLSDLCWILFVGLGYTFIVELLALGVSILTDAHERPVFPRWAGTMSIVVSLLTVPGLFVVFTTTGPLAWDGLVAWWLPAVAFGIWMVVMTVLMLQDADRQDAEDGAEASVPARVLA